ncbi:pollen-specific leucine-rich repeat extensin-like protein 3 [Iris pallida]|uniref:Pollen-specific leucine-rich repeat extensin-like protein 3 n=1 Tax=Iris pallida TaxID=29817 RepID=A0AAX6HPW4_IRIPA|nr:pollen-specific leucine-rich repeat extensin-like protein 3 [Iris pallida]
MTGSAPPPISASVKPSRCLHHRAGPAAAADPSAVRATARRATPGGHFAVPVTKRGHRKSVHPMPSADCRSASATPLPGAAVHLHRSATTGTL